VPGLRHRRPRRCELRSDLLSTGGGRCGAHHMGGHIHSQDGPPCRPKTR
jgi:hypothetical protein